MYCYDNNKYILDPQTNNTKYLRITYLPLTIIIYLLLVLGLDHYVFCKKISNLNEFDLTYRAFSALHQKYKNSSEMAGTRVSFCSFGIQNT